MRRRLLLLAAIVVLPATAYAQADNPKLNGVVGPAFNISLLDANGQPVTKLDPGAFDIAVRDLSEEHNFHLFGPGVDETTSVTGTGNASWTVTFREGRYTFVCDPHSSDMRGTFVVGNPTPGPKRWTLCSSERSRTEMSNAPGSSFVTGCPLASSSEMLKAGPTTPFSFGLSACA